MRSESSFSYPMSLKKSQWHIPSPNYISLLFHEETHKLKSWPSKDERFWRAWTKSDFVSQYSKTKLQTWLSTALKWAPCIYNQIMLDTIVTCDLIKRKGPQHKFLSVIRFLKVMWSIGNKGSEIFRENSHLFDFHLKAYYVCRVTWKLFTWNVLSICRIWS